MEFIPDERENDSAARFGVLLAYEGVIFMALIERMAVAGIQDGTDDAGRAVLREAKPAEIIERAGNISRLAIGYLKEQKLISPPKMTPEERVLAQDALRTLPYKKREKE